jgi:hypothetical protein
MAKKMTLVLLAVVVGIAVIAAAIYASGALSKNNNEEIEQTGNKITFTFIDTGFKVKYDDRSIAVGAPFYVPTGTASIDVEVYTPSGSYQVNFWTAHDVGNVYESNIIGSVGGWFTVTLYLFGDCDYDASLSDIRPR